MTDPMIAIRNTFFQECEEQLAALEAGLLAMEAGENDPDTVNAVFRAVHSIKGGAGAFGLDALVRFAHVFETALDQVRSGRLVPDPGLLKLMLRASDALADLVRAARDGSDGPEGDHALVAELGALTSPVAPTDSRPAVDDGMDGLVFQPLVFEASAFEALPLNPDTTQAPAKRSWTVRFTPRPELYAKANETAVLLRELGRLGPLEVALDASALPPFPDLDPEGAYLSWTIRLATAQPESAIREVFEFVEDDCNLEIAPVLPDPAGEQSEVDVLALIQQATAESVVAPAPPSAPKLAGESAGGGGERAGSAVHAAAKPTIRVDLDRVDRLIDLVGELVINQAMLAQRVTEAGLPRSSSLALGLGDLEQLTRELQDSVMAIRAQPVKSVFQRIPRLVREVAALTGKSVRLLTEGENTEVDKTVIEHLADPLTHMIRNAIDHGLERPVEREKAGKPAEGTVRLAARHRSGRIVIEVSDDGGGINRPRVRAIAVEKGLIPADAALTDDETDNLIFMPGFSTADAVSDISGRGVGMDVVRRSVQALGGRISIASRPGEGSTFTMSLPLTLAVLDGMVVSVAGQTLVAPLTAIVETLRPRASDVHRMGRSTRVVAIRGSYFPLVDVGTALGYRAAPADPTAGVTLLIEGEGGSRAVLLVDAIQGQRQVVIKSLEANYRPVPGIAAATILGDGRVALIVDVDAIVAVARTAQTRAEAAAIPTETIPGTMELAHA